jgi:hypothetical protein
MNNLVETMIEEATGIKKEFSGKDFLSHIINNGIFLIILRYLSAFGLAYANKIEIKFQLHPEHYIPLARFQMDATSFAYLNAYSILATTVGACIFFWLSSFHNKFSKELVWANYLGTFTGLVQFGILTILLSKSYSFQLIHSFVWALLPIYLINVSILYLLLKKLK